MWAWLGSDSRQRRRRMWAVIVGVFVVADLSLFGWLIFRSLSQRELDRIVLEARAEAEELAEGIAGRVEDTGRDLYTAMATASETRNYINNILVQRDIVETVEVRTTDGRLVFRDRREETQTAPGERPNLESPDLVADTFTREVPYYQVDVPVGSIGTFVIGISRAEIEQRLAVLRRDLLRQAAIIAALTVALFVAGYVIYSRLSRQAAVAERQAREAEQMAYVGTLASGLAHEIRSPLNSLNLNMQMLQEGMSADEDPAAARQARRLVAITRSEVGRLEHLVSDFLSYARPADLDLEETTAAELLRHLGGVVAGKLQARQVASAIEDRTGGVTFQVDREQVNQLLLNLVDNAVAAMDNCDDPRLRLEAEVRDGSVVLAVGDNGPGVDEEERERVFDLFHSGRRGGTGLGLAIVRRIANAHGGEVRVRNDGRAGATFEVELPLKRALR
ncbi:MAG: HAMP domain-containing sensor histidine kinase [Acidobacteria bacterium]|nr:HAMP domain-containing sensor histidine kinase [Acidobacteriota bacterium]